VPLSAEVLRLLVVTLLLASAFSDLGQHWTERRQLRREAVAIVQGLPDVRGRVLAITERVRQRVMPREREEPLLRATAWDTWRSGEGTCGDGARVAIVMLDSLGIRATRLYLRNSRDGYIHVAVAYFAQNTWHIADTLNSEPDLRAFLLANQRPLPEVLDGNRLFYSYSFLNWTRVAPFLQFDQTVAPLAWIVHVTESAALMRAAAKLMLVVVSLLVLRPWAEQA